MLAATHMEVPPINDGTRCTEIDAEALENLRRFFGILAEWDEADRLETRRSEATNPGVPSGAVADSLDDGVK